MSLVRTGIIKNLKTITIDKWVDREFLNVILWKQKRLSPQNTCGTDEKWKLAEGELLLKLAHESKSLQQFQMTEHLI